MRTFFLVAGQRLVTEVAVCKIRRTFICRERESQDCVAEMINLEWTSHGEVRI